MVILTNIIFYILAGLNIISGIRKKRSNALFALALIVVFVLMTFNYRGPDIEVYIAEYETVGNSANPFSAVYMERGYTLLTLIFCKMGVDFFAFRAALTVVILALFISTIRYYKAQGNLIVGLYMLYLFIFDTIQIRNCLVQFIILFSTRYLFQRRNLSTLKYLLCVAVAASIHTIALIYLSLILLKLFRKESFYMKLFIFVMLLFAAFVAMQPLLPQIALIISRLLPRGIGYMSGTIKIGWLIVFALYVLGLGVLAICKSHVADKRVRTAVGNIIRVNVVLGLFLPMTFFNNNFNRIFRNNILLTLIGLSLTYMHAAGGENRQASLGAMILISAGWIYSDIFARYEIGKLINPIFDGNLLINGLATPNLLTYIITIVLSVVLIKLIKAMFAPKKRVYRRVPIERIGRYA